MMSITLSTMILILVKNRFDILEQNSRCRFTMLNTLSIYDAMLKSVLYFRHQFTMSIFRFFSENQHRTGKSKGVDLMSNRFNIILSYAFFSVFSKILIYSPPPALGRGGGVFPECTPLSRNANICYSVNSFAKIDANRSDVSFLKMTKKLPYLSPHPLL